MPLVRKGSGAPADPRPAEVQPDAALLLSGTAEQRWDAARALGASPDGTRALSEALRKEADSRVREAIFVSLARIGSRESVVAVVAQLRSNDSSLRTGALDALRVMIDAVRPHLPLLLTDPDPTIRLLICDLVRDLPSAEGTRLLCDVLERETEPNVCAAAVDVLADIGEAASLPYLERCAERFRDESFLTFAVKVATGRIIATSPGRHG
jgi:HEAT repeat protein